MPRIEATVECPVFDSFRVRQVAGMFDVPLARRASRRFAIDLPDLDSFSWRVGSIVGPSGSGKTTLARRLFGDRLARGGDWPRDRAVVDALGELPVRPIVSLLTAVGFSSPPSWLKPYHVLSTGEQFRCDLARALARGLIAGQSGSAGEPGSASGESAGAVAGARAGNGTTDADLGGPDGPAQPAANEASSGAPGEPGGADGGTAALGEIVAFDEFTSVVDRDVARVIAAAVSRSVRQGRFGCRFVAVTCHRDVVEWLAPDWTIDTATARFERRRLRRPPIELRLVRCRRRAWRLFADHHYLSGALNPASRCYLALWDDAPVAFCAVVALLGKPGRWRVSRLVVLPEYQGIGIGGAVLDAVCESRRAAGLRMNLTASHPAVIAHCRRSPHWRAVAVRKTGSPAARRAWRKYRGSAGRAVVSFEYVGPAIGEVGPSCSTRRSGARSSPC